MGEVPLYQHKVDLDVNFSIVCNRTPVSGAVEDLSWVWVWHFGGLRVEGEGC